MEILPAAYTRSDGETIIYAGRVSSIYGRPGCGKSFIALDVAKQSLARGSHVLWIDAEDNAETLGRRADLLGCPDAKGDNFWFSAPELIHDDKAMAEIIWWLERGDYPGLVIIDACESAGCPVDGSDVKPWMARFVEPFKAKGIGVLMLDHIPKNSEGRADGPIGSNYKFSSLNGVGLRVSGKPWNQKVGGRITLTSEKDRQGQLPVGLHEKVAVITGDYVDDVFTYAVGKTTGEKATDLTTVKALSGLGGCTGRNQGI